MTATVELSFSPDELNLILVGLGQLPYLQVHELIGRIQAEAGPQLLAARGGTETGRETGAAAPDAPAPERR